MAGEEVATLFARLGLVPDEAQWSRGDKLIDGMKKAAGVVAGYLAVNKVKEWIGETVSAGTQALSLSQKLGVSTDSVQELGYAAKMSGVDIESLSGGVFKLSHGLVNDLKAGSGTVIDTFHSLGISTDFLKKKMSGEGGVDDILGVLADKFQKMEEGPKKVALAMNLFGRSGAQLIPFLNKGSKGIGELRDEAHSLGIVLSETDAKDLREYGHETERLGMAWDGVKRQIVTAALPVLQAAATFLLDKMKGVVAWVRENKDEIALVFSAVGHAIVEVARVIGRGFAIMANIVKAIAMIAAKAWEHIAAGADEVGRGFSVAKGLVSDFFDDVEKGGQMVVDFFVSVAKAIRDAFQAVFDWITTELPKFIEKIPVIGTIGKAAGHLAGHAAEGLGFGGGAADGAFENAKAMGYEGTEDEFNAERQRNIERRFGTSPSAAPSAVPVSTNAPVTNTFSMGDINVQAPIGADAKQVAALVGDHVRTAIADWHDETMNHAIATVDR